MANIERALDIIRAAIDVRTRQLERPPRQPVEPAPYRACHHGNDSLLCERCRIVDREMSERRGEPHRPDEPPPRRAPPSSPGRYSREPGLVNRPPEPPGTVSRQGF